jgi:hypothetical protein
MNPFSSFPVILSRGRLSTVREAFLPHPLECHMVRIEVAEVALC